MELPAIGLVDSNSETSLGDGTWELRGMEALDAHPAPTRLERDSDWATGCGFSSVLTLFQRIFLSSTSSLGSSAPTEFPAAADSCHYDRDFATSFPQRNSRIMERI